MRRSLIVALIMAAAVTVTAAVGFMVTRSQVGTNATTPAPGDADHRVLGPQPAGASARVAAQTALAVMFGWRPAVESSPGAALARACPWLTGDLARDADAPAATGLRPHPDWQAWRRSGDVVTATAEAEQAGECADESCSLPVTVRQVVLHRDGSSTPYRTLQVVAVVHRTDHGWRLGSYHLDR